MLVVLAVLCRTHSEEFYVLPRLELVVQFLALVFEVHSYLLDDRLQLVEDRLLVRIVLAF